MKSISFSYGGASARLVPLTTEQFSLQSLYSKTLSQGDAHAVMELIIRHADENGLELILFARRFGYSTAETRAMNNAQLAEFYQKFGFELDTTNADPSCKKMIRRPSLGAKDLGETSIYNQLRHERDFKRATQNLEVSKPASQDC